MAKLIYSMITSLDGYAAAAEGDLGRGAEDEEVHSLIGDVFRHVGTYLYGRRMYETWIQMTQFLRSGQFDPTPVITHRFPLEQFDDAIAAIKSGSAGKVVFEIS